MPPAVRQPVQTAGTRLRSWVVERTRKGVGARWRRPPGSMSRLSAGLHQPIGHAEPLCRSSLGDEKIGFGVPHRVQDPVLPTLCSRMILASGAAEGSAVRTTDLDPWALLLDRGDDCQLNVPCAFVAATADETAVRISATRVHPRARRLGSARHSMPVRENYQRRLHRRADHSSRAGGQSR